MTELSIARLGPGHASEISACFRRVYGESYANELFYDIDALESQLDSGRLCSVGALVPDGRVVGHMAMVCAAGAKFAELGNTVVDPEVRGSGVAWQVGSELTAWCVEKGYPAYLHYPTTDHHIMQRRSVQTGFETGLMLGYIPAETDGQVNRDKPPLRGAATIVFNPLGECASESVYFPPSYKSLLENLATSAGLRRIWKPCSSVQGGATECSHVAFVKRGLARLEVHRLGTSFQAELESLAEQRVACKQLDFLMSDAGMNQGVEAARRMGFVFCGWLPGYRSTDVFRLQRVDWSVTDLSPNVVNPGARALLNVCRDEIGANDT